MANPLTGTWAWRSACVRLPEIGEAWEITRQHHLGVIGVLKTAHPTNEGNAVYEIQDATFAGDIADVLAQDGLTRHRCPYMHVRGMLPDLGAIPPSASRPIWAARPGPCRRMRRERRGAPHAGRGIDPLRPLGAFVKGWQEGLAA